MIPTGNLVLIILNDLGHLPEIENESNIISVIYSIIIDNFINFILDNVIIKESNCSGDDENADGKTLLPMYYIFFSIHTGA